MNQRLTFGLTVARSKIDGKGCFAAILYRQNQRIAEYVGGYDDWLRQRPKPETRSRSDRADSRPGLAGQETSSKRADLTKHKGHLPIQAPGVPLIGVQRIYSLIDGKP